MNRPQVKEYQPNYQNYFDLIPPGEYFDVLAQNRTKIVASFENIELSKHNYRYEEGKWTIKELFMHIIDTERVFANRALMALRGDDASVQRMDEELYAKNVNVESRTMESLIEEFLIVRNGTKSLFSFVPTKKTQQWCAIQPQPMTARALGYFIIGHAEHHMNVLHDRYLKNG